MDRLPHDFFPPLLHQLPSPPPTQLQKGIQPPRILLDINLLTPDRMGTCAQLPVSLSVKQSPEP